MEEKNALLATALLLISCSTACCVGEHRKLYYMKSDPTQPCPDGHNCDTLLSYFDSGSAAFFLSNTTLHFLPGIHSAVSPEPTPLVISNVSNLLLTGPQVGPGDTPLATIVCNYTSQFRIENSYNVSLKMEKLHMSYSLHFGLVVVNCNQNISIQKSKFYRNCEPGHPVHDGGNLVLSYSLANEGETAIEVINCHLSDCYIHPGEDHSGGLSILVQLDRPGGNQNFTVTITNNSFYHNTGGDGGHMVLKINCSGGSMMIRMHIHIHSCNFSYGRATGN